MKTMRSIVFNNHPLAGEIKASAFSNGWKGMSLKLIMFSCSSLHYQQETSPNGRKSSAYEIRMQISYSIYSKISSQDNLLSIASWYTRNYKRFVQMERSNYHRRSFNEWPRPSSCIDSSQICRIAHYGLLKRPVVDDDFWTACKSEVQVR